MSEASRYIAKAGWCENCLDCVEDVEGEVGKLIDGAVCPDCQTPSIISGKTRRLRALEAIDIAEFEL